MIEVIQPVWKAPSGISALCTTRHGGLSSGAYSSLNLARHVGDDPVRVDQNRDLLRQQLDLPAEPEWIHQTHGIDVVNLDRDSGRDGDAAVTSMPATVAVVMTADCLPILLCNRAGSEVAAVHAGWRGLRSGVVQAAIAAMQSPASQLMAWIGPGISQDCFEVGDEVRREFVDVLDDAAACFVASRSDHWLCDLPGLATRILSTAAVDEIYLDPHCSYTDDALFFSYRRQAKTGRMASLIWIN